MNRQTLRKLAAGWRLPACDVPFWELEHYAGLVRIRFDADGRVVLELTETGKDYVEDIERDLRRPLR